MVNPSSPQALGVILLNTWNQPGMMLTWMKEPPRMPKVSMMAVPMLPTCPGVRAREVISIPQPVAAKDCRQDKHEDAKRVAPLNTEQERTGHDQDEHLDHAGQVDAKDLADQHLGAVGGGDQQARQGAVGLFRKDGAPAVADGEHQEHQRHPGSHVGHRVESLLCLA